ncbi:hypothetical protein DM872_10050 [Pseudomonas taiwanensis]|nr:hypothetical protein [Pseudomonas taiwanensis]
MVFQTFCKSSAREWVTSGWGRAFHRALGAAAPPLTNEFAPTGMRSRQVDFRRLRLSRAKPNVPALRIVSLGLAALGANLRQAFGLLSE